MEKPKQYSRKKTEAKKFGNPKKRNFSCDLYDQDWVRYRFRFLHYNKRCYICPNNSSVVDHYIAHKGDEKLFRSLTNHIPLCKQCHDIITGMFDKYNPPKTQEKHDWILNKRFQNNINTKVIVLPYYKK